MKRIAETLDTVRATTSRNAKIYALAQAFGTIAEEGDDALRNAVRISLGEQFAPSDSRSTDAGWQSVATALAHATGASDATIHEIMRRLGDLGDAVEELLRTRVLPPPGFPLSDVEKLWASVANQSSRKGKADLIAEAFTIATPLEAKYLAKTLLGEVRTGALAGVVLAALAKAFDQNLDEMRRAHAVLADVAEVAVLASHHDLRSARITPGMPVAPMLATPMEGSRAPIDWSRVIVEDKLDGIRAQVHVHGEHVSIFARGHGLITRSFPDVSAIFVDTPFDVILDGEILVVSADGRVRPFQSLQPRLGRVSVDADTLRDAQAIFVAYDILYLGTEALIDLPWHARHEKLEELATTIGVRVHPFTRVGGAPDLEVAFAAARGRSHEGVMIKRIDSHYEAGTRGAAWLKVKKAAATIDVVVTAVEQGHGKRASMLSDYTFAVWEDDALVDVGKAFTGLTNKEIRELGMRFEDLTIDRHDGFRTVRPEVVLEVAFDGVQRSRRHVSGFALRFPRIARVREDKTAEQADTLETVVRIFQAQLASGHREDIHPPERRTRKRVAKDSGQLNLFFPVSSAGEVGRTQQNPIRSRRRA